MWIGGQDRHAARRVAGTRYDTAVEEPRGGSASSRHIWRDMLPFGADSTVNAYIEISRGDRRKWEFDMGANAPAIDRVIPEDIGGYPVNYGFVPQTVWYRRLFLRRPGARAPLPGGIVRGVIVGLMFMEDEKGIDSKVVLSPVGQDGRPRYRLTGNDREVIAMYFRKYKCDTPVVLDRARLGLNCRKGAPMSR